MGSWWGDECACSVPVMEYPKQIKPAHRPMQKITSPTLRVIKAIYLLAAMAYHWIFLNTYVGNYYHGGTWIEWVAVQSLGVLITTTAIKLWPRVSTLERVCDLSR
ncbi:hypothetical protein AwPolaro_03470 [Polaromonas sp.]|nr:hypothetical protein AwPolaro_03470 [Polaromonas sp.]